jgi:hypothetical protein
MADLKAWWGAGFAKNEYTVPQFEQLLTPSCMLLKTRFDPSIRTRFKQRIPKDSPASKWADRVDAGLVYTHSPHGEIGAAEFAAFKGSTSFVSSSLTLNNPSTARVPAVSLSGATMLQARKAWQPVMVRALASNFPLDPARGWKSPDNEAMLALEWNHGTWSHGTRLHRKKNNTDFSLVNNLVVGTQGVALGAEVETSAIPEELRDYNIGAQYHRKNAFIVTAGTEQRLKSLYITPLFYFGKQAELSLGANFQGPTASFFSKAPRIQTCLQYQLPRKTTLTTVKTKFDTKDKTIGLALENNDLPYLSVSGSVTTSLDSDVRGREGARVGLSLVLGDNNKEADHADLAAFGAATGARCPYCH